MRPEDWAQTEPTDVKLIPRIQAGRTNRRARAYGDEIARLRREGYGYVAIQHALADAGVIVSKSTVQREVARLAKRPPPCALPPALPTHLPQLPRRPEGPDPSNSHFTRPGALLNDQGSPRDIAEAFFKSQITNPLFKHRS